MDNDEVVAKKVEEIETIYRTAVARIAALKEEQFKIIEEFMSATKEAHLKVLKERVTGSKSD